ncbi:MAG: HalOD1 output domain-containing protein [Haloferacaceae archaeon]
MTDDTQRSPSDSLDVCERVLQKVADTKGIRAERIGPQLYDVVDPDALNRLFEGRSDSTRGPPGRVEFAFADCRVVVYCTGDVDVSPLAAERARERPPQCG